jgi:hypothetical protein
MSAGGRGHRLSAFDEAIDNFMLALINPQEAAALTEQQFEVLRANLRSEILFSEVIRKTLTAKAQAVIKEFK